MRVRVLQIVWHNKEPVFSVDFHSSGKLATAGADGEIKLWDVSAAEDGSARTKFLCSITGDKSETGYKAWNCVRFCPTGASLAAVGDGGQIFVWKVPSNLSEDFLTTYTWVAKNCGAYSQEDVMDLSWASDGSGFVSASNDNTCMIWDPEAKQGKAKLRLEGHRLYVQGVAWDPLNQYVVSQGADRSCRVYAMRQRVPGLSKKVSEKTSAIQNVGQLYTAYIINKLPPAEQTQTLSHGQGIKTGTCEEKVGCRGRPGQHLFHDESLNNFFRRLSWSPDGSILVLPAGVCKAAGTKQMNVAYAFARGHWSTPLLQLPTDKPVVAVRFCPVFFEGSAADTFPVTLPYNMVFALATRDSVAIYATSAPQPLVILGGLHLETITDLAWAPNGTALAISSYDSYCSIALFEEGELGAKIDSEQLPDHIKNCLWQTVAAKEAQFGWHCHPCDTDICPKQREADKCLTTHNTIYFAGCRLTRFHKADLCDSSWPDDDMEVRCLHSSTKRQLEDQTRQHLNLQGSVLNSDYAAKQKSAPALQVDEDRYIVDKQPSSLPKYDSFTGACLLAQCTSISDGKENVNAAQRRKVDPLCFAELEVLTGNNASTEALQ